MYERRVEGWKREWCFVWTGHEGARRGKAATRRAAGRRYARTATIVNGDCAVVMTCAAFSVGVISVSLFGRKGPTAAFAARRYAGLESSWGRVFLRSAIGGAHMEGRAV